MAGIPCESNGGSHVCYTASRHRTTVAKTAFCTGGLHITPTCVKYRDPPAYNDETAFDASKYRISTASQASRKCSRPCKYVRRTEHRRAGAHSDECKLDGKLGLVNTGVEGLDGPEHPRDRTTP